MEQDYTPIEFPDFDKLSRMKQIELAKEGSGSFAHALEAKNKWKLFPFHYFTNFCVNKWVGKTLYNIPELLCDYCGDEPSGNGHYYTHYIVFEDPKNWKIACCNKCLPRGSLSYYEQQWGFREPIVFPDKLKGMMDMEVVWDSFMRNNAFQLRGYIGKQITESVWRKEFLSNNMSSSWGSSRNDFVVEYNTKLTVSREFFSGKPILTLTRAQIIDRINKILVGQPNEVAAPGTQLTLF